ncbi:hypothetical protein GC163_12630 [bacterium]|nr:hypothetical protein [bacterium]
MNEIKTATRLPKSVKASTLRETGRFVFLRCRRKNCDNKKMVSPQPKLKTRPLSYTAMLTEYNITADAKNCKHEPDISDRDKDRKELAAATFSAFLPYISNKYWGINKKHAITKSVHVAFHEWCEARDRGVEKPRVIIRNKDGSPWKNVDGETIYFNYYHHWKSRLWSERNVERANAGLDWDYFQCCARAGKKMAYIDADAHERWQDDLDDAITLLKELFKDSPFWRYSPGGYNGWLKIGDAPSVEEYNAGLARLDQVLKDTFAQRRIKTSIEIKGRSAWKDDIETFDDRRSHLAKLPYYNYVDAGARKDADDCWNQRRLDEFIAKPDIYWKSLMAFIEQLEKMLDREKVDEGRRYLESLKSGGKGVAKKAPVLTPVASEPEVTPQSVSLRDKSAPLGRGTDDDLGLTPGSSRTLEQIRQITDAFERNREFALYAARLARRPLTADELLEQDRLHHIHNGEWEDGLANRKRRYQEIAPFVARNFDASKCGKKTQRPVLDKNIKYWKARAHLFPSVALGYVGKRAEKIERSVLIALTAIIQTASQPDGDCPRDSIQGWWEELASEGLIESWDKNIYTAARSILVRYGLVKVDHHRYRYVPDAKGWCKGIWITGKHEELVGEQNYTFPTSDPSSFSPFSCRCIMVMAQPSTGKVPNRPPRPPPRGQPPPIVRFIPSFDEQISWF